MSKLLNGSEEDTFRALRRLSMSEMKFYVGEAFIEHLRRRWKEVNLHGYPQAPRLGMTNVEFRGATWDDYFIGTGWTVDEYVEELIKVFNAETID